METRAVIYARAVMEHLAETKPNFLREEFQDHQAELKKEIGRKVEMAQYLRTRYQEKTEFNEIEINEMLMNYLAPADELPTETVDEVPMHEVSTMMKVMKLI